MIKLEKILGISAVLGLIIYFTLITFSNILLAISLTLLSFVYYPFGFALFNRIRFRKLFKKISYNKLSAIRILGAIVAGMSLSTFCLGVLFKLFDFKGGNNILIIGLASSLVILPFVLFKFFKTKQAFYTRIMIRFAIIGSFGILILCLSTLTFTKIRFHHYPDYIKAYESYIAHPDSLELQKKMYFEYKRATMTTEEFDDYQRVLKLIDKKRNR
jgi:hypothetical protein